MTAPWYALMRAGVHACSAWSVGPVPPLYSAGFAFPTEGPMDWKVLHDTGRPGGAMLVEFITSEEWLENVALQTPETHAAPSLEECIANIIAAAQRGSGSIGDLLAAELLTDVGIAGDGIARAAADPSLVVFALRPGLLIRTFSSLLEAVRAGYRP